MYLGWLLSVLVMVPNIFFFKFPPTSVPASKDVSRSSVDKLMEIMERIGQIGVFAIPFFYQTYVETVNEMVSLAVMTIFLVTYYIGWLRFFSKGRRYSLLYSPLMGLSLPLAISPVIYFSAASVFLNSWVLLTCAIVFGIGHIYVSWGEYQKCLVAPA
jgi:hypothetical protein